MELKNFNFRQKLIHHPEHLIALRNGERPFPTTCEIDLTNLCNHDCYFCVVKEARETHRTSLETTAVLDAITQMRALGVKGISFTGGGEPLVHRDFYTILEKTHDLGIHTGLMTNGALLRKGGEYLRHLNWIRVSVGAGNRELYQKIHGKDDFDRVIANIHQLGENRRRLQADVNIGVRIFLDFDNYHTLPSLAKLLEDSGIDYIQVAPDCRDQSYPILKADDFQAVIAQTEQILQKTSVNLLVAGFIFDQKSCVTPKKCYAHYYQFALTATGDIIFCKNFRNREDSSIGNIYQSSVADIWNSEKCLTMEATLAPHSCGEICKNMQINTAIEEFLHPANDMSINFVG